MLNGKASKSGGAYDLVPSGNHPGVLVGLIDLGTHWDSFQQQAARKVRRVLFVWELEAEVDGKDKRVIVGKDFSIGHDKSGNLIYGEKSKLRQTLESWRGAAFGANEEVDLEAFLGKPCLVNVAHIVAKSSGNAIAKVEGVSRMPKGMKRLEPTYNRICYSIDSDDFVPDADWLPRVYGETILQVIERSLERNGSGRRENAEAAPVGSESPTTYEGVASTDEDAPF